MKTLAIIGVIVLIVVFLGLQVRKNPALRYASDFLTPIVFYGKVVDDKGNPVPSADVRASFADGPGGNDTEKRFRTDPAGAFQVSGHGMGIIINVSKTGYDRLDKSAGNFCYCADTGKLDRHLSSADPALFVLRKKGDTEHLIVTKGDVRILRDGTPIEMNLTTGKTYNVTNGDIIVQAWTQDQGIPVNTNRPYDWRCKIMAPGGGIQMRTGDEFTAPENGYQPSDEINMSATSQPWRKSVSRSYFLHLGNGSYARMDFTMRAGGAHFFSITSYLNPQPGHRNLESATPEQE